MKSSLKEKLFLITFAAMVLLVVLNIDAIYGLLLVVLGAMNPLFVGGLLAFVLNVPMKKLEDLIEKVPFLEKETPIGFDWCFDWFCSDCGRCGHDCLANPGRDHFADCNGDPRRDSQNVTLFEQ